MMLCMGIRFAGGLKGYGKCHNREDDLKYPHGTPAMSPMHDQSAQHNSWGTHNDNNTYHSWNLHV